MTTKRQLAQAKLVLAYRSYMCPKAVREAQRFVIDYRKRGKLCESAHKQK